MKEYIERAAITKAIREGVQVPGAHLEEGRTDSERG